MINRIIFSDNGVLYDKTKQLNNYHSDTVAISAEANNDYLYVSSKLPFNHIYFDIDSAATTAMNFTPQIYDGTEWNDVVDTIDETNGFTESGFITWTPDKDEGWGYDDTEDITSLSTISIYGEYWMRLKLESSENVTLNWIGNRFSNDDDLADEYPNLNNSDILSYFASGKTNWDEQHIVVARDIVNALKIRGTLVDRSQILERRQLVPAAVHRLARLIYNHLGDAYRDQRDDAQRAYKEALGNIVLVVDTNANGRDDKRELYSTGSLYR